MNKVINFKAIKIILKKMLIKIKFLLIRAKRNYKFIIKGLKHLFSLQILSIMKIYLTMMIIMEIQIKTCLLIVKNKNKLVNKSYSRYKIKTCSKKKISLKKKT